MVNVSNLHLYTKNIDIQELPLRVNKSLHAMKISPHSIFIFNGKPLVLFFQKTLYKETVFKQCWNFTESPIIIIEDEFNFEIYNGYDFVLNNGNFLLSSIKDQENLNYLSLIDGSYLEKIQDFNKDIKQVDTKLLENIDYAREELIDKGLVKEIANALIGRIIFIRYLIDRKIVLNFDHKIKPLTNDDLKIILSSKEKTYELFSYLKSKDGFNGDWFPIVEDKENNIYEIAIVEEFPHLNILKNLISGTEIKTKQASLFDIYDFSIIPIEFISNVYESFIGEEERSKSGAYYTPKFLVDYILKHTVDKFFEENPNVYNCSVLDPACGSGIFLVEVLRKLIKQFEIVHSRPIKPNEIIELVINNIYAIDKDKNAVLVSVFSLYLTMLDYLNPKEIESFLFPYLMESEKNPNKPNFFNNDFFDTKASFNAIIKDKRIQFIIGNPPYGRSTIKEGSHADTYVKANNLLVGNRDIVQPFMMRVRDFANSNTKIGFIVASKVLYNLQTKDFRIHNFFNNFLIEQILELSSVRKEIFEGADVPVSIIFYRKGTLEKRLKNVFTYISMKPSPYFKKFKILMLAKNDFKKIQQKKIIQDDSLWKTLIYGSYLDYKFIKALKNSYCSIYDFSLKNNYPIGMGIQATKGKSSIPEYIGKDFIDIPRGKESDKYLTNFYIAKDLPKWTIKDVHRKGNSNLFKPYSVLITRGVDVETLKAKAAILDREAVFKHTLTGVNVPNIDIARNFSGLINSSFFAYFNLHTASSLGIEREQLHDEEKLKCPYIESQDIIQIAQDIEVLKNEYSDTKTTNIFRYHSQLSALMSKLDSTILTNLKINDEEKALYDYATEIIIPWVICKNYATTFRKLTYREQKLEEYANVFIKHYSTIYEQNQMYFQAKIIYSNHIIGIKFQILKEKPLQSIIWEKEDNIKNFHVFLGNKTLDNLFIQKDIKGFEKNGFYVIKPNEYKNWHKAIGYLDFYEFRDAILKAGKSQWAK